MLQSRRAIMYTCYPDVGAATKWPGKRVRMGSWDLTNWSIPAVWTHPTGLLIVVLMRFYLFSSSAVQDDTIHVHQLRCLLWLRPIVGLRSVSIHRFFLPFDVLCKRDVHRPRWDVYNCPATSWRSSYGMLIDLAPGDTPNEEQIRDLEEAGNKLRPYKRCSLSPCCSWSITRLIFLSNDLGSNETLFYSNKNSCKFSLTNANSRKTWTMACVRRNIRKMYSQIFTCFAP